MTLEKHPITNYYGCQISLVQSLTIFRVWISSNLPNETENRKPSPLYPEVHWCTLAYRLSVRTLITASFILNLNTNFFQVQKLKQTSRNSQSKLLCVELLRTSNSSNPCSEPDWDPLDWRRGSAERPAKLTELTPWTLLDLKPSIVYLDVKLVQNELP